MFSYYTEVFVFFSRILNKWYDISWLVDVYFNHLANVLFDKITIFLLQGNQDSICGEPLGMYKSFSPLKFNMLWWFFCNSVFIMMVFQL